MWIFEIPYKKNGINFFNIIFKRADVIALWLYHTHTFYYTQIYAIHHSEVSKASNKGRKFEY